MKQYTSEKDRKRFYELHQTGQTYAEIAAAFGVSYECVRHWCRRQRDGGEVKDQFYNPRAGTLSQFSPAVRDKIVALRRANAHWGPASLLLHLGKDDSLQGAALPSRASIGRYVYSQAEFRRPPKKSPPTPVPIPPSECINA
jgi:transposase-like protein